jgi:predicted nuclease of predicted toxin-antitoxin system
LRFLVDENLGASLASHLKALGHDAVPVSERARGASDEQVLALAVKEQRILVTEDKDFGALVFRRGMPHAGLLLVRLRRSMPAQVRVAIEAAITAGGDRLQGRFAVVREGTLRLR